MRGGYALCIQVKQYVAVVANTRGQRFCVFKTGDEKYYLFDPLIGDTSMSAGNPFPVAKKSLRDDLRRALLHGWGNSL